MQFLVETLKNYSKNLTLRYSHKKKIQEEQKKEAAIIEYFFKFLNTCQLSESSYIRTPPPIQSSSSLQSKSYTSSSTSTSDTSTSTVPSSA